VADDEFLKLRMHQNLFLAKAVPKPSISMLSGRRSQLGGFPILIPFPTLMPVPYNVSIS